MDEKVLPVLITAAGSVLVALIGFWAAKAKARSETSTAIIGEWRGLLEATRADLSDVKARLTAIEDENKDLHSRNRALIGHVWDFRKNVPDRSLWPDVPSILKDDLE